MKKVVVKDKTFKVCISQEKIRERVKAIAADISCDMAGKKPLLIAVLNGSFVFAADLMRELDFPCEISFVRLSSYVGTASTGKVRELIGLSESIEGRSVIVVEDIIDSGLTMQEMLAMLTEKKPADVRIASLLVKPDNLKVNLDIRYRCFDIPNDFIVGYGLDYDGEGRNLPDIYVVEE